ncbi:MAG: CHAT domain-containing protein, partial [Hassallia sp.]
YNIAKAERDRGNLQQALTQIQAAVNIIEDLRTKVDSQDLRTSYFASKQDVYKFYIDLLMQLHKKDPSKGYNAEALHASESSRARGLIELLTEARANIRKGVDPQLLEEEKRLQLKIEAIGKQIQELSSKPQTETAQENFKKELETFLTQRKELETKIRTSSPKYAALQYPQPLKLPQIQQQLDKDSLLLEYSLGSDRSYLWAVTPNSIDTYELPKREEIEKAVTKFRENLQPKTVWDSTAVDATKLSKIILAPVADKLGKKRLVVVADGTLQKIPFAALTEPGQKGNSSGSEYQPLIVNHEIVNLPSITAIATQRQDLKGRKTAPLTLAILADPVFEANDPRITGKPSSITDNLDLRGQIEQSDLKRGAKNLNRDRWERIKGTRTEADAILKLVPSNNLQAFGFDANYNWVTNPQLSQYRFVHFATHGFADPNNPELSGIVLSLLDKQAKRADRGYLRLGDIFNLDFAADLVVLSACDTGLGKDVNGEGLVGLTRGLMYAGAERVAVSLWQVNDDGTAELMQEFYTEMLKQGKSPTVALRAAQLKLWQSKWQNPYYWSAFTLQGEWR